MPKDHQENDPKDPVLGASFSEEIVYLNLRERLLIEHMGGVFPERNNKLDGFKRVLDIPCRAGTWISTLGQEHPEIQIVGLERMDLLVEYVRGITSTQGLSNIRVEPIGKDITSLSFPDDFFDLVHVGYLFGLMQAREWPAFLKECLRITRPGGYIRVTESEWGITSSASIEKLSSLFLLGLQQRGYTPSPDGRHIGIVPILGNLLKQAGWSEIKRTPYAEDFMLGPSLPDDPTLRVRLMINPMLQTILTQNLATKEEIEALLSQAAGDVGQLDFGGLIFLLSFCARKPV